MKYVLFVCTQNAGRSQIAEALFAKHAPDDLRAESAGAEPADACHPVVVEAMREIGIDLSTGRPKRLTLEMQLHADWRSPSPAVPSARTCPRWSRTGTCPIRPAGRSMRHA